ncbi:condensin-2 complex subunit D3 [Neolamprologus brichardi]|uniref:condensin-2 complex subunit D3 n=1 Tax=Neolamprologus brichardi TaxID=32507 RepID=UPI001643F15D|nr:condensin-2 complex subunit D3 [Neolamprologus brichardi]
MDLISALQFLRLNDIPEAWVDAVWDVEFTERKPLDKTIEEELTARQEKSFTALYQCLLAHADQKLSGHTQATIHTSWTIKDVCLGKRCECVWLSLLLFPGSISNKVFHEVLLDTCLDLTRHCWPQDSEKKRKKDLKSSQTEGKRSRPQRKDGPEMEMEEEDEEEEEVHLSGQDLMRIRDAVALLVQSLLRLLQTLPLKASPQTLIHCMQIFSNLLYFEPTTGKPVFAAEQDITKLRSVPEMAFYGLQLLCLPKHGDQKESLRRVFHQLLYVILMMKKGNTGKPSLLVPSQTILATRDQAVQFVCHLVDELKELALPFLQILLQHICFQMVEKNEYRSHGAQAVGMLTSQMAGEDYARFIKWLCNFSRSSKMVHRLFSVDVVMVLLEQPERRPEECRDPDLVCFLMHSSLIQNLLFARRMDESPTVQGHALNCLAQCLELPSLNATRAIHNLFSATGTQTVLEGEITEGKVCFCYISCTKENLALLLRRVKDSKTNVRKAALQALLGLLKHDVIPVSWENLQTLSERCRDPSVSVKKKALQCVGELLSVKPECSVVQRAWLQGVVPAVADSETSVQDKALEALDQVLLSQVKPYSAGCQLDASQRLMWDLLGLLCHQCQKLSRYFSKAFTIWSKQKKFTPSFISSLISHTEADHAAGAWLLLSKVVSSSSRLPYGKILDAWDKMVRSKDGNATTCCHILCVMGDIAVHLNEETKERVVADLMSWLKTFTLPLEVISSAVETLYQFGCSDDIKQTQAFLNQRCGELVSACEAYLSSVILTDSGSQDLDEELMLPSLTERHTELPASLPLSQFKANRLPTRVRAHGVITLGKLALQNEELAQKYLPVFARELEVGTEVSVRSNVVVIMCDLCVRYTNMVDHYIPNISACLRDKEAVIREQTVIMLTNLLQEEFVKWKGSLFFDFMVALVDPVPAIARERVHFSLKGEQYREKRFRIYCFLLEHFTDAQRFNVTNKINQTILACFADEELPLDADGANILSETFNILGLKEFKLQTISSSAGAAAGEEAEEENMATMAKAVLQAAQKKVVSQVRKKAFTENTVPLIISLKNLLEQKRSPVLRDLMGYLQVTLQDYRNEVKEIFSGDEQLAAEMEFALKIAERERATVGQLDDDGLAGDGNKAHGSAQRSPVRSTALLPLTFATPQPPRPNLQTARLALTDRVRGPRRQDDVQSKSIALEGTGTVQAGSNDQNTLKSVNINLTFDEGLSAILSEQGTSDEGSVLHVRSSEAQAPGPRQWNVQSPLRLRKRL